MVDDSRLRFRDASGNTKASQTTVDFAIADYKRTLGFEDCLQEMLRELEAKTARRDTAVQFKNPMMMGQTIRLLSLRSEDKLLQRLAEDAERFNEMIGSYELTSLKKDVLLEFVFTHFT